MTKKELTKLIPSIGFNGKLKVAYINKELSSDQLEALMEFCVSNDYEYIINPYESQ